MCKHGEKWYLVLPPVHILHEEEGTARSVDVHRCINSLHPSWKSKEAEFSGLPFDNRALHCPECRSCQQDLELMLPILRNVRLLTDLQHKVSAKPQYILYGSFQDAAMFWT